MTIFKLEKTGVSAVKPVTSEASEVPREAGHGDQTGKVLSPEIPHDSEQSSIQSPVKENDKTSNREERGKDKDDEVKLVKIDGPISHIYTQALNQLLANEELREDLEANDMIAVEGDHYVLREMLPSEALPVGKTLQVYACPEEDVTSGTVVELMNEISRHPDNEYLIVAEAIHSAKISAGALCEHFNGIPRVNVRYTRHGGIEALKSALKRHVGHG